MAAELTPVKREKEEERVAPNAPKKNVWEGRLRPRGVSGRVVANEVWEGRLLPRGLFNHGGRVAEKKPRTRIPRTAAALGDLNVVNGPTPKKSCGKFVALGEGINVPWVYVYDEEKEEEPKR
jgi:hypothetical protein